MKKKYTVELEVFVNENTSPKDVKYTLQSMIQENFLKLTEGAYFLGRIAPGKITVKD